MKAMLLRVGMDKGYGDGFYGPIFRDYRFEFVPIPDDINENKRMNDKNDKQTFSKTLSRWEKISLSDYLPKLENIANRHIHYDPAFKATSHYDSEFKTTPYTYGDNGKNNGKLYSLMSLEKNDLLVFYAGLKPRSGDVPKEGLYLIGCFNVRRIAIRCRGESVFKIVLKGKVTDEEIDSDEFKENSHIKFDDEIDYERHLVIIQGYDDGSKLLDEGIPISKKRDILCRNGKKVPHLWLSDEMQKELGVKEWSLVKSTPRVIDNSKGINYLRDILKVK